MQTYPMLVDHCIMQNGEVQAIYQDVIELTPAEFYLAILLGVV
jgi:hypothetical protein